MRRIRAQGVPCPRPDKFYYWPERAAADAWLAAKRAEHPEWAATVRVYACRCGNFHVGRPTPSD
jgi:hypothetical protein